MADTQSEQSAEGVAPPKCWYWDVEGQPRHVECGGEVTFFETLDHEAAAICLTCCECGLNWREASTDGRY